MGEIVEIRAPTEQTEGTRSQVLRWLRSVGEAVEVNEPLLELETDKVTIEIPAPASGLLREIVRKEQQDVSPGELLGQLEIAVARPGRADAKEAVRNVAVARGPAERIRLSPAVRRLLKEHRIDASAIQGTGRDGRITAQDITRHVTARQPPAAASPAATAPTPAAQSAEFGGSVQRVPHSALRQRIAEHMVRSLLQTAPHVTTVFEADLSAVIAHRARYRESFERQGGPLTFTPYFVAAAITAIRAVPEANARWTEQALELYEDINVGIATALGREGLIVPVLKDAQTLNLLGIARGVAELIRKAREGALAPTDVQGGTFTISNHGVSGSLIATPIVINQPQSAILGIGKLEKRVIVKEIEGADHILIRPMCYVTLTIDHRVMDGFTANRFLQVFTESLERWPIDP